MNQNYEQMTNDRTKNGNKIKSKLETRKHNAKISGTAISETGYG